MSIYLKSGLPSENLQFLLNTEKYQYRLKVQMPGNMPSPDRTYSVHLFDQKVGGEPWQKITVACWQLTGRQIMDVYAGGYNDYDDFDVRESSGFLNGLFTVSLERILHHPADYYYTPLKHNEFYLYYLELSEMLLNQTYLHYAREYYLMGGEGGLVGTTSFGRVEVAVNAKSSTVGVLDYKPVPSVSEMDSMPGLYLVDVETYHNYPGYQVIKGTSF